MSNAFESRSRFLTERIPSWTRMTIGDWFDRLTSEFANREHIFTLEKRYTYSTSRQMVDQIAKSLLKLGIRRREHIAMIFPTVPEMAFLQLAVAKIGAVNVPLNERLGEADLEYQLKQSDSVYLFAMDKLSDRNYIERIRKILPEMRGEAGKWQAERFPSLRGVVVMSPEGSKYEGALDWETFVQMGDGVSDKDLAVHQKASAYPDEVVLICYTSGTTGKPKGVMLTHDMLMRSAYAAALGHNFAEGERVASPLPLHHLFIYVEGFLASMFVGGAYIPQALFEPPGFLKLLSASKATFTHCVPTISVALLNYPNLKSYDLSSLKSIFNAAAATPLWVWEALKKEFNLTHLGTGWGMTETSAAAMYTPPGAPFEVVAGTVGLPKQGGAAGLPEYDGAQVEYKLVDPVTGDNLPPQIREGELAIRGNIVTRGYYKKPLETQEAIDKDGWLRTGDIFRVRSDGYYEITGRAKDLYKIGGELVAPKEIEEAIVKYPKINQVYICGVPDEQMGEVGAAFIQLKHGESCTEEEILTFLEGKVARFKIPRYVSFVSDFPVTASGKVQKFLLREMAVEKFNLSGAKSKFEK